MPKALLKDDFKNIIDYQEWLHLSWKNLSAENRHFKSRFTQASIEKMIREDKDWFGENVTFKELEEGVTTYQKPELLDSLYNKVQDIIPSEIVNRIQRRKLKFNAMGLGVFCFDRAAMTLYRNKEWYHPQTNQCVSEKDIDFKEDKAYAKHGTTVLQQRWEQSKDGKDKVRTATKDLFAWFPQENRNQHAVEFFMSADAAGSIRAKDMLYAGVAAIILAELLIIGGVKVKINIVIGSALDSFRERYVGCVIPIKQYDEPIDRNLTSLMSSDPRFMRFDAFKGVIAAFDHFNMECPSGMGYAMDAQQLKTLLEDSGYTKNSLAAHRYYFGGTFSERAALNDISNTINDIAEKLNRP